MEYCRDTCKFDVFLLFLSIKQKRSLSKTSIINITSLIQPLCWVMASLHDILNKYQKWCRLVILIQEGGEFVCKDILSKMGIKDITDGAEIYKKLKPYEKEITKMTFYQQKSLLPDNGVIDTTKRNISLNTHIIQILDKTKNYPLISELRQKRNELFHMKEENRGMTEELFNYYWDNISSLLAGFGYDIKLMKGLKTEDHMSQEREKTLEDIIHNIKGSIELVL